MLTTMDASLAIGLRHTSGGSGSGGSCPPSLPPPRALLSLVVGACRRFSSRGKPTLFGTGFWHLECARTNMDDCYGSRRSRPLSARVRSAQGDAGALPDSSRSNWKPRYHPSEEIEEKVPSSDSKERRLTDAEIARTTVELVIMQSKEVKFDLELDIGTTNLIIQIPIPKSFIPKPWVNSKATLVFSGYTDDEVHENIIWPYLPYFTDEHGDIYFEVNNEKEILQTLTADDKLVQVIIGLDNIEMLSEMELLEPSDLDFEVEEIYSDDSDIDDEYEEDATTAIHEDEVNELISSENMSDWTNLETMQSCNPMYFAKKIEESISNSNLDWMDQPPASIVIQGHLRPAFFDENNIKKLPHSGELDCDRSLNSGAIFYKLEMINIQIVSAYGNQVVVKIQDFLEARPDILAHSAANIISRLKSGGEKISEALKVLCLSQRGIHVEEAIVIGIDSLGLDLRVCSGRQVQTLRFSFDKQAVSEFSAEKQLNDLLFPHEQKHQRWQQAHHGVDN